MQEKVEYTTIAVTPELRKQLRIFKKRVGASSYGEAIAFLLAEVAKGYNIKGDSGELGYRLNPAFKQYASESETTGV